MGSFHMQTGHKVQNLYTYSSIVFVYLLFFTLQALVLHASSSLLSPTQSMPPFAGGGLVQVRVRSLIPPPQVTLHSLQAPKSLQPPFIGTIQTSNVKSRATGV